MYEYILFDFDGTVVNSSKGVFGGVIYALKNMELKKTGNRYSIAL